MSAGSRTVLLKSSTGLLQSTILVTKYWDAPNKIKDL